LEEIMKPDWLERLSKQLSLIPFSQDWGICNADASRLEEFLDFYDSHIPKESFELEALAELIFQSAEEAIAVGGLESIDVGRLASFIRKNQSGFPMALEYWRNLETGDWRLPTLIHETLFEMPIRKKIRRRF
jgi:hypothetical protein